MNSEWFKNRANQKFKESIDLLNKVKDNIYYIHAVKEGYAIAQININNLEWTQAALKAAEELDTILSEYIFHIIDIIDSDISEYLQLVKTNSIEGGTHKAVAQEIIIDGINVYCPECRELIADTYQHGVKYVHKCPYCNQKLDWNIKTLSGGNNNDL